MIKFAPLRISLAAVGAAVLFTTAPLSASTIDASIGPLRIDVVADGLREPWGLAFLPGGGFLVTERDGDLWHFAPDGTRIEVSGVPEVWARGQGGLLDVEAARDFETSRDVFLTFSKPQDGGAGTALAVGRLPEGGDSLEDVRVLFEMTPGGGRGQHFGSRIVEGPDGHLFLTIGDRGNADLAQDQARHNGTVVRLDRDGAVPPDNPFVGAAGIQPEIWSYGHRNPQGLVWDNGNQRLWEIEHGPRGGDEINRVEKGRNYGWPVISYGKEYWAPFMVGEDTHREGMEQPVKYYDPSIAPGSLLYYDGDAFPDWRGNLFAGALKLQHLNRVELDPEGRAIGEERLFQDLGERIRSLTQGPQGWIYFSTDSGKVFVIKPKAT